MATDLRGLFQNNRRREAQAVVGTVPAIIEPADLREGTAEVVVASGDYTLLTLPNNVVVHNVYLVVDEAYDSATSATFTASIGGTSVFALPVNVKAVGLSAGTNVPLLVTGGTADVVATMAITGATTTGTAKLVIEYVDYDRGTMSYIGE